jgi:hypothetical protein
MKMHSLVALLLVLAAAVAVAGGNKEAAGTGSAPMEISWLGINSENIQDGNPVQRRIEQKFNVRLINKQINFQDTEKLNLMISSGEHPEAMYTWVDTFDWFMKGAFRSIPKSAITRYAPLYTKDFDSLGPGAWYYGLVPGKKDEYIGMVRHEDYQNGVGYLPVFRLDYLEKANLGLTPQQLNPSKLEDLVPQQKPGTFYLWYDRYNWNQLEQILYAFRDKDLDGNGRADTIPYVGGGYLDSWSGMGLVFYTFGVNQVNNFNDGGKTVMMDTYTRSKEALKVLQRWFRDRIIDSELPALDWQQARAKIVAGIAGSFMRTKTSGIAWRWGGSDYAEDTVKANPNAKTVVTLMPLSPFGDTRGRMENKAMPLNESQAFVVKRGVSDQKLAKILEIYDYLNFDTQGMILAWYGTEENYTWSGEPYKSPAIPKPDLEYGGSTGVFYYSAYTPHKALLALTTSPDYVKYEEYFTWGEGAKDAVPAYREDIFRQTKYVETWARYGAALRSIRDEFFWKAITSNLDIETEWPKYVQTWMSAGGSEVLAELEKAPTVADIRSGRAQPPTN